MTIFHHMCTSGLLCLLVVISGHYSQAQESTTDSIGNLKGEDHDWVKKQEYAGKRIILLRYYTGSESNGGNRERPFPRVCEVLRTIGFEVDSQAASGSLPDLVNYDQCWIVSSMGGSGFPSDDIEKIREFLSQGKGVYILADNAPYLDEANRICSKLHGATIQGNYVGEQLIHVAEGQQGFTGAGKKITGIKGGKLWAADHELLSGLKAIYEGITISHLSESPSLHVVLRASNGRPLVSVSTNQNELIVYDCGYTRMFHEWEQNVVSSTRWYQNVAAYLMGKKRRDLRGSNILIELELDDVSEDKRAKILEELANKKGKDATMALVAAATVLPGNEKRIAQNLLVKRLKRMKVNTLSRYLIDDDHQELRVAAAQAAGAKDNPEMVEPLIDALNDPSVEVARAANGALQKITSQEFGVVPTASGLKKHALIKRWKKWWSTNGEQ